MKLELSDSMVRWIRNEIARQLQDCVASANALTKLRSELETSLAGVQQSAPPATEGKEQGK